MKKITLFKSLVLCAFIMTALFACVKENNEKPVYVQENFADVSVSGDLLCNILGMDYYVSDIYIYHVNNLNAQLVYTPIGTYMKPENYPNWQLRTYLDKEDSIYVQSKGIITQRKLPNDEAVACENADALPPEFKDFIKTHEKIFNKFYEKEVIEVG